jgi:hypothetical protein
MMPKALKNGIGVTKTYDCRVTILREADAND